MARPLRIEYPGAVYYITSHGNGRQNIFLDSKDALSWIEVFEAVCVRFKWICHAYCLMGDHYHIVIETPASNLSKGMRQLNGVYTQDFNRRYDLGGHVFRGRFKSIIIQKDKYLTDLIKFVLSRPLKSGFATSPEQFKWSSCKYIAGKEECPEWLDVKSYGSSIEDIVEYYDNRTDITDSIRNQIYIGDDLFISEVQQNIDSKRDLSEIPKVQRSNHKSLEQYESENSSRDEAIGKAYMSGDFSMKKIADHFSLHYSTVSRIVKEYEKMKL